MVSNILTAVASLIIDYFNLDMISRKKCAQKAIFQVKKDMAIFTRSTSDLQRGGYHVFSGSRMSQCRCH